MKKHSQPKTTSITPDLKGFPLHIDTNLCSNCSYCISVCPFEAISHDPQNGKIKVDPDKCKLCGICYATCPSRIIEIDYYNTTLLFEYIQKRISNECAIEAVLACQGTGITPSNWLKKLNRTSDKSVIFLSLPCVGRIHIELLTGAVEAGIKKITLANCEQKFCRYKKGSEILDSRLNSAQTVFTDLGYPAEMLSLITVTPKAVINEMLCTGCQMCINACPYKAIELKDINNRQGKLIRQVARVNPDLCEGCGVCVATCPSKCPAMPGITEEQLYQEINTLS